MLIFTKILFFTKKQPRSSMNMLSANENNSKSHSPNVINVDLDSDPKPSTIESRMTLGELTDSIIKMQTQNQGHLIFNAAAGTKTPPTGPSNPMHNQDSIMATDQWKYNRKIQQHHHQQQQAQQQAAQQQHLKQKEQQERGGNNCGRPSSASDDRQIIRMAQTPSPRSKSNYIEPVSPPDNQRHFYLSHAHIVDRGLPQPHSPAHLMQNKNQQSGFLMDNYVKNRIMEVMRTPPEGGPSGGQEQNDKDHMKNSSPGDAMIIDEDRPKSGHSVGSDNSKTSAKLESIYGQSPQQQSRPSSQPPITFNHPYPFSALSVSAAPPGSLPMTLQITKAPSNIDDQSNRLNQPMVASKPLLSDQYEALSDED